MTSTSSVRTAGILLHPTSLPGPYGIGDLGPAAYAWVDSLARARQTWWQVLPLGPTGFGDSPYQCFSAFAGNPYLISPQLLQREGLLRSDILAGRHFPSERVDYGAVIPFKQALLRQAWDEFQTGHAPQLRQPFEEFRQRQAGWLADYALFMALKAEHQGRSWTEWEANLIHREMSALDAARQRLQPEIGFVEFSQFLFFRQWSELKQYANARGVRLIGDVPIFVSADSADVWANPSQFLLDASRRPTFVAGVPPDYFSPTGQLWGNPLYDWKAVADTGYAWWIERLRTMLEMVDLIRIDHFRGFAAAWHIPAGETTAVHGKWVEGPGIDLFNAIRGKLGTLPLIAEDLGEITPDVVKLREDCGLPGMRILQFAFDGPKNKYLPHHYDRNTVVYTGTHDNDTTNGWYATLPPNEKAFLHRYLGRDWMDVPWELMRLAWSSIADIAIAPLQDLLRLGGEARMNLPGRADGNWSWRVLPDQVRPELMDQLGELTETYLRVPAQQTETD